MGSQMMHKMLNKRVIFDCDDVLANLRDPLQDLVSEHLGKKVSWEDWNQYQIGKIYDFDFSHICQMIVERDILQKLQPEPHAKELISWYKDQGCETIVLTARGYHPNGYFVTKQWLKDHDLEIDHVMCINITEQKRDHIKNIVQVEDYIEDNHSHAEQASGLSNVQRVYLMDRPWNQEISLGQRVKTLKDILDIKMK